MGSLTEGCPSANDQAQPGALSKLARRGAFRLAEGWGQEEEDPQRLSILQPKDVAECPPPPCSSPLPPAFPLPRAAPVPVTPGWHRRVELGTHSSPAGSTPGCVPRAGLSVLTALAHVSAERALWLSSKRFEIRVTLAPKTSLQSSSNWASTHPRRKNHTGEKGSLRSCHLPFNGRLTSDGAGGEAAKQPREVSREECRSPVN